MIKQSEIEIIVSRAVEKTIIAMSFREENENFLTELETDLREMLRDELTKAGVAVQKKRQAIVKPVRPSQLNTVKSYLPHNYEAYYEPCVDASVEPYILIEGYDRAGWTLDGYVIPRLGSGLIFAKEIE